MRLLADLCAFKRIFKTDSTLALQNSARNGRLRAAGCQLLKPHNED
jgi:hypothetical protein